MCTSAVAGGLKNKEGGAVWEAARLSRDPDPEGTSSKQVINYLLKF